MKKYLFSFILLLVFFPTVSSANVENVGIINGIWFSETELFAGESFRIYTAVQNNSGNDIDGEIEFFDNDISIGVKSFSALNNRIIESWIDVVASEGKHLFSIKITELDGQEIGGGTTPIDANSVFSEIDILVNLDTDGDRIPDELDEDDDGDGYSDIEEKQAKTDPLDKDSVPLNKEEDNFNVHEIIFDETDLLNQSPKLIQDFAKQNNIVKSLAIGVSNVQNFSKDLIKNEQSRVEDNSKTEKISVKDDNSDKLSIKSQNPKDNFSKVLSSIYGYILEIISWLFSLWWFVVILLFFGIYVFLKLLFKIFSRRN